MFRYRLLAVACLALLLPMASPAHIAVVRGQVKPATRAATNVLKAGSTGSTCVHVLAGASIDPAVGGTAACVMTPTATAGLGKATVAKFVLNAGQSDPQVSGTKNVTAATNMFGTTTSGAHASWASHLCRVPGPRWEWGAVLHESAHSSDGNLVLPGAPAGEAEAETKDPMEFDFTSADSIEFRLSLGDPDSVFSFQVIGGEASFLYSCSYFNVSKDGSPLNGELFSVAIDAVGTVTSTSQLQITCTAWPGAGLSGSQLQAASDYIRANMTVLPDSSIGWANRELSLIGPGGPIPAIVLDVPVGTSRFEDFFHTAAAINQAGTSVPEAAPRAVEALKANPNPFLQATKLRFNLSKPAEVKVRVFDVSGRLIRTLRAGHMDGGVYEVPWDGRNDTGEPVAAGTYFIRAESDGRTLDTKVARVK